MNKMLWDGALRDADKMLDGWFNDALEQQEATYTTVRCEKGVPLFWPRHVRRLSAALAGEALPFRVTVEEEALRRRVASLLSACGAESALARIAYARKDGAVHEWITLRGITVTEEQLRCGVRVQTSSACREADCARGRYKGGGTAESHAARQEAERAGAYEGLILSTDGDVLEGAYTNLFIVYNGCVITPPETMSLLRGVVREVLLELCGTNGIPVETRPVHAAELAAADELFLTNCHIGVLPVCRLDNHVYAVGGVTRRLQRIYADAIMRECAAASRG